MVKLLKTKTTHPVIFQCLCILFGLISLKPPTIFAEGTGAPSTSVEEAKRLSNESSEGMRKTSTINNNVAMAEEMSAEAIWFGFREEVTIATRRETPASKAPSIVTVITAEEIKNLGYRTFVEVLRTAPGFEVLKYADFGFVSPSVRGVATSSSANRIRLMLNGHFVNNPLRGGAFGEFDDFPVESIKRIEIIRGPGSAMYGENAFSAVINIITKDAKDIDGARVSSGYGSFETYDENIVFGKRYGKIDVSGMVRYRQTGGFDGIVKRDSQTAIDTAFGTSASLAPGKVYDARQEYDINLKAVYKDFYVEGLYTNRNKQPFVGPQSALTGGSNIEDNYVFGEFGYKKTFEEKFTLKPRVYYDQFDVDNFIKSFPDGTTIRNTSGTPHTFPNGFTADAVVSEKVVGTEVPFDYELFDGNIFTIGLEYRLIHQTNIRYFANFNPSTNDPLASMQDFSNTLPFIKTATRRIESIYLQDTWNVTDTVNLTLGVRHDEYNDFGGTTSPRAGLTWSFMKDASLKALYGEAFRAPSFVEMFTVNQPAILGNENLHPETIKTYEVGLSYNYFNKHVTSGINYFYNDIKDLIVLRSQTSTTSRYENFGNARVHGVEAETKVDISKGNYVFMNYTFQDPEDDNRRDLPFIAEHKGNFGVNMRHWKYINTNLSTFVSGSRSRESTDTRRDLPGYALLNLSIIGKEFCKTMEVQGTIFNILDKQYSDPGPAAITNDLPRPGRTFFVGLSFQF
ncbi:MAG: TonB-dependent receptor [Planctomycetota bacterium]|nr:TonB-dependent receptor [Planctomycetota bacterium]